MIETCNVGYHFDMIWFLSYHYNHLTQVDSQLGFDICCFHSCFGCQPKNRGGPPKWMVYFMENPIKMDDFGGPTPIFGLTPLCF